MKLAELRRGVSAWLEDGRIRLFDKEAGVSYYVECSWARIEREAIYSAKGLRVGTREYEQAVQRYHCER